MRLSGSDALQEEMDSSFDLSRFEGLERMEKLKRSVKFLIDELAACQASLD